MKVTWARKAGSEDEFDSFFDDAWPRLQGQASALTGSRELAQDLTQEALLRAWRSWEKVSRLESPEGWTRMVLHNLCIASWRKTRRQPTKHDPVVHGQIPEFHAEIAAAMRSLPGSPARALLLHDRLGMTVAEVADERKAPEGTVKSWLSRSRRVGARLEHLDRESTER
jgi:RNA polymerase sigma-70 factor (ECF subfamily)